jgi:F-type H+-transporting ATPase subunit a
VGNGRHALRHIHALRAVRARTTLPLSNGEILKEEIGAHPVWNLPVFGEVHADVLLTTWIVMAVSVVFFAYIGLSYGKRTHVTKLQATFEGTTNYLSDLAVGTLGRNGEPFVPLFIAIFFFIFLLNQVGFIPFKQLGLPFGGSPTADLNTTAALAIMVFLLVQGVGIARKGFGNFAHLAKPFPALLPINVLEEIARPITLALRLFFNIFVGEILLYVIATIIASHISIGAFNLSGAATVIPFLLQFFNFFVGTLQAFVFTLLTIVYMAGAVAEEH